MKQSIYIECYEGLSARMLTEALLDLMPEGKAARKLVAGLRKLSCSEAARQEMLHNMQCIRDLVECKSNGGTCGTGRTSFFQKRF